MLDVFFLFMLGNLLWFGDIAEDPVNEAWLGRQKARQFECERISQAEAHQRYPGDVPNTSATGSTMMHIDALVCERHIVKDGVRSPRDEVILRNLSGEVTELSALAAASLKEGTRWKVDAYYPNPVITRKVANASRMAFAERGISVSDAPPRFTAGDVAAFRKMKMRDAIAASCERLHDTGQLDDDEAFLALALLHARESQLHAGTCYKGKFRWIR